MLLSFLALSSAFGAIIPLDELSNNGIPVVNDIVVVKVLILSGNNNHDWKETTPYIRDVLLRNGNFIVDITERPDTINDTMLQPYHVIINNWNAYPEQNNLWNQVVKQSLINFVSHGKGFVCIHGASAAHADWPPFLEITGGTWGDKTHHGPIHDFTVQIVNPDHPITQGLQDFTIRDELWVDINCIPSIEVLCAVQTDEYRNTPGKLEPVALITRFGQGRGYYLVLGHDTSVMAHPSWQKLLINGTKWAALPK